MNAEEQAEFAAALTREHADQGDAPIEIKFSATTSELLNVLGMLQVAFRHPTAGKSLSAKYAKRFARCLEERLAQIGPATARLCAMGWSAEFDR